MKNIYKRSLALVLIVSFLLGFFANIPAKIEAASKAVSLSSLGEIGSVDYVGKKKTGKWYKIYIDGNEAFCENLGYTCHTGDVYKSSEATYSNKSTNRIEALKAYLGYWYDVKKSGSQKAYIFAQSLFWAINEGLGSEADLKAIIKKMKENTGYFSSYGVKDLYNEIFTGADTINTKVVLWKYEGSGNYRQELLEVKSSRSKKPKLKKISDTVEYRQRITLIKKDEDGNFVPHVKFKVKVNNIDELYNLASYGYGEKEKDNPSKKIDGFEAECETNEYGIASFRFTYKTLSEDYYYYDNSVLDSMSLEEFNQAKKELKDDGLKFASNLSKNGALAQIESDLEKEIKKIKNSYTIYEVSTGNNKSLLINDEYKNGKTISLDGKNTWIKSDNAWPDEVLNQYEGYIDSYVMEVVDKYKKIKLNFQKIDSYSKDKKSHGLSTLEGAEYGIFTDPECKKYARIMKKEKQGSDSAAIVSVKDGAISCGYLKPEDVYYVKEIQAPQGYLLSDKVYKIEEDFSQYNQELNEDKKTYELEEDAILGDIAIQKYSTSGETGFIKEEKNAVFQIYLKDKKEYSKCDEYECDTITTDERGYAKSKKLYYGTYIVHQLSGGDGDTEKIKDFEVEINEVKSEPYYYVLNNKPFSAHLRIVKKDKNTGKSVLKEGTAYEIYKLDENNNERRVSQNIITENGEKEVKEFVTNQSGEIMTPNRLLAGKYRIYEKRSAEGLHIVDKYIDIEIGSEKNNYISKTDENGNTYSIVEVEYINEETCGRIKIEKEGKALAGYEDGEFVYDDVKLDGAKFEVVAKENIETKDGHGDLWFEKEQVVAQITSGKGVEFTNECGGICKFQMENEYISIDLPLGKYYIREVEAPFGHIKTNKIWNLSFEWSDPFKEYEENLEKNDDIDSSDDGILHIKNEYAQTMINIEKKDQDSKKSVKGAVFELYTKDDIYNYKGEKIAQADQYLGTAETDENGDACFYMPLPIKDDLNSGDYYLVEKNVGRGYYKDDSKHFVHLEYKDDETSLIYETLEITNKETKTCISKKSISNEEEIKGCYLEIYDSKNNLIISWISGNEKSIKVNKDIQKMGYQNFETSIDKSGNLLVYGLFLGEEYSLKETRPAKGYVTAQPIKFVLDSQDRSEKLVEMKDDVTKLEFQKTSVLKNFIGNVKILILDDSGKEVLSFITKEGMPTQINGILEVGKTYTFMELYAPEPFIIAEPIQYTILDTKDVQRLVMVDDYLKKSKKSKKYNKKNDTKKTILDDDVPKSKAPSSNGAPKTGDNIKLNIILALLVFSICGSILIFIRRRKRF